MDSKKLRLGAANGCNANYIFDQNERPRLMVDGIVQNRDIDEVLVSEISKDGILFATDLINRFNAHSELCDLVRQLALIVRTQNGNQYEDINALLNRAGAVVQSQEGNATEILHYVSGKTVETSLKALVHVQAAAAKHTSVAEQKDPQLHPHWQTVKADIDAAVAEFGTIA